MALSVAYQNQLKKQVVDTLIVSHFDGHGVATAAARARVLMLKGQKVAIVSRFPETGPTPQFVQLAEQLAQQYEAKTTEIIDIPVNVQSPQVHIEAEAKLPGFTKVHYDHHETSIAFTQLLINKGIVPVIAGNAVQLAAALELFTDDVARELAIIGIVSDRDPTVLTIVDRREIETKYLDLANKLDVIVRQPQVIGCATAGDVALRLANEGVTLLESTTVNYPPYSEVNKVQIIDIGTVTILADFENVNPQWQPKTAEELLRRKSMHYIVFIAPALDPRTRQQIGYDVRVLQYWLSDLKPEPEQIVKDIIYRFAVRGNIVGHAKYVSIRLQGATKEQALDLAGEIYRRIEGTQPSVTHLISDQYVAEALKRDFTSILEKLTEILETQKKMYEEYLQLKKKQVELLERSQRREYD